MVAMTTYAAAPTEDLDPASDAPSDPNEPMSQVQAVRLRDLSRIAKVPFHDSLTKAQAQEQISELEKRCDQPRIKLYRS